MRALLDAYAGAGTQKIRQCWSAWRAAQQALAQARAQQGTLQRERGRLQWQIGEVEKLAPGLHEWEELNTRHTRLSHARALADAAQETLTLLENDHIGVLGNLGRAHHLMAQHAHIDPQFQGIAETLASSLAQVEDARHSLHGYTRRTELDPRQLEELDTRLAQWLGLARRYKRPPQELPLLLQGWKQELQQLDTAADLEQLEAAERAHAQAYDAEARRLSQCRAKAAPLLSRAITQAMQGLGMAGGVFAVQVERAAEPAPHGHDQVGFLVAGHPGMTPRPICRRWRPVRTTTWSSPNSAARQAAPVPSPRWTRKTVSARWRACWAASGCRTPPWHMRAKCSCLPTPTRRGDCHGA